jgi:hypothetical protein
MTTSQEKFFGPDYPADLGQDNQDGLYWVLADFNHRLILKINNKQSG